MVTEGLAAGLEREGRTIITCNDVETAQLVVERMRPSHVVSDVKLTGPFGFEGLDFIRHVKRHCPESPVILMTGDAPEALQLEAAERGAVAFLQKPFEVRELDAVLDLMAAPAASSAALEARVIRMPLLEEILRSGLLVPFFQPIVALDGKWPHVGYEALARYRTESPLRNPETLFKYAGRKDRIAELEFACVTASLAAGKPLVQRGPLFLNIHPDVFSEGGRLHDALVAGAEAAGVPLERIVLEITEQSSLSDRAIVMETIRRLQKVGIRFAFDDAGVAYSHLPLIDKIRPSFLKVSQHFGTSFETDSTKMKIVMNLLSLANDFRCELILEGIEDASTAEMAADLGIPFGQGFFFAVPADAAAFH